MYPPLWTCSLLVAMHDDIENASIVSHFSKNFQRLCNLLERAGNILWITDQKKGDKYNLNFIMSSQANGFLMA